MFINCKKRAKSFENYDITIWSLPLYTQATTLYRKNITHAYYTIFMLYTLIV